MLKLKSIIHVLLLSTILLCFYPVDHSIAGPCADKSSSGSTPTVTGDHNYTENWHSEVQFQYDPSSPDEINKNSAITIKVIGGCSPYTWSVSGAGFTIADATTASFSNTLYADGTACGSATITVIGCEGAQVEGYVRCTTGQWGPAYTVCGSQPGPGKIATKCDIVIGKTLYTSWYGFGYASMCPGGEGDEGPCDPYCEYSNPALTECHCCIGTGTPGLSWGATVWNQAREWICE